MHTQKSRNHTVTKFAAFVQVVCDTKCTKFCSKRTTFDKVIVKPKNTNGPKFANPSKAAASLYFKRLMTSRPTYVTVLELVKCVTDNIQHMHILAIIVQHF